MKKIIISIFVATLLGWLSISSTNAAEVITPESSNVPTCSEFYAQGGVGSPLNSDNPSGVCLETKVHFGPWHLVKLEKTETNSQDNLQRGFTEDQTVAPSESDALCKEFIAKGHAEGVQNYLEACGNPTWTFGPLELTPSEPKPNQP